MTHVISLIPGFPRIKGARSDSLGEILLSSFVSKVVPWKQTVVYASYQEMFDKELCAMYFVEKFKPVVEINADVSEQGSCFSIPSLRVCTQA